MKSYTKLILIFLISFGWNCQEEPVKNLFPGLSNEDATLLITGTLLNQGYTDNRDGTVTDNASGLVWQKCSQGQVYKRDSNDCQGFQRGATQSNPFLNLGSDALLWGAQIFSYCSNATNACNSLTIPQTLQGESSILVSGVSEAFQTCQALNPQGAAVATSWRVPNPIELQKLSIGGRNALIAVHFPNTVEDYYWSSWSHAEDLLGQSATAVIFERKRFGETELRTKTDRYYMRCVRNR